MPLDSTKTHTFSIRRPKSDLALIRELARRLKSKPSTLISEAFKANMPALMMKAGMVPSVK